MWCWLFIFQHYYETKIFELWKKPKWCRKIQYGNNKIQQMWMKWSFKIYYCEISSIYLTQPFSLKSKTKFSTISSCSRKKYFALHKYRSYLDSTHQIWNKIFLKKGGATEKVTKFLLTFNCWKELPNTIKTNILSNEMITWKGSVFLSNYRWKVN